MTKIVNIDAYSPTKEEYAHCEVYVDMEAHGVNAWTLKSINGTDVMGDYGNGAPPAKMAFILGIDPITYDQVDAAARLQLRGEH